MAVIVLEETGREDDHHTKEIAAFDRVNGRCGKGTSDFRDSRFLQPICTEYSAVCRPIAGGAAAEDTGWRGWRRRTGLRGRRPMTGATRARAGLLRFPHGR